MSVARRILLALSTNRWLRERATRTSFVRRSVSTFMPGERLEDAMAAAAAQQTQGIGTIFTKLGENLTRVEDAEEVTAALPRRARQGAGRRPSRADLGQADTARPRSRQGTLFSQSAASDRPRGGTRQLRLDRHGKLTLCRSDARPVPPHAGALAAHRYRDSGVPLSDEGRRRIAVPLGAAIRLVKGAYLEPPSIAYPKKADVDENFYELSCRLLADDARKAGGLLHMATHDPRARRSADGVHRRAPRA